MIVVVVFRAKKIWRTSTKQVWTGFFEEFKKSAIALNKNEFYTFHQDDVAEVANKLSEMAEQVEKTKVVSREEQMSKLTVTIVINMISIKTLSISFRTKHEQKSCPPKSFA